MQIGIKMEPGDCPTLNINAMPAISVKSFLNMNKGFLFQAILVSTSPIPQNINEM